MMPNDNIEVVHQHQMVVAWIRLRQMKKLKETKLLLIKILIIIEITKMILTTKAIVKITIIIKCRDRYRTPRTTNKEILVTLHNGQRPLPNIKKSSP